jgi:GcrA cell cycle regulator
MSWTEERIEELTRLWQSGHSASDIGKRLGMSKNAVVGKAHRLKLPSRPSPIKQNGAAKSQGTCKPAKPQPAAQPAQAEGTSPARRSNVRTVQAGGPRRSSQAPTKPTGGGSGCLWPIGDPGDPDFHFCGAEALPGKPYCGEHAARAYITRSRERDEEAA